MSIKLAVGLALSVLGASAHSDVLLGAYNFNSQLFGNTLVESDGGTYSATNWLNVLNANPGNPGSLTGANFDTGIANIPGAPSYTIGYGTSIVNGAGADLGIVVARFSADTVRLNVSSDGGSTYFGAQSYGPAGAVNTGVTKNYFYGGSGPFLGALYVMEVDLSDFGVALGASINTVQFTGSPQLDIVRIAGFGDPQVTVPEPASLALVACALAGLACSRRRSSGPASA
jgi:hypothetical protein